MSYELQMWAAIQQLDQKCEHEFYTVIWYVSYYI